MTDVEAQAMEVINKIFANKNIPTDRIKSIHLNWESVYGDFLPVLKCEFYEDKTTWKTTSNG